MIPGDFWDSNNPGPGPDDYVDFDDVQYIGEQAVALPGGNTDDTYDFDGDGGSDLDDARYMIANIMDRVVGDVHPGSDFDVPGDVDTADIGKAVGEYTGSGGTGKTYFDGDMDFDNDVDVSDIGFIAGAYTGSLAGSLIDRPDKADLIYDPVTGNVKISATEAGGGVITAFQLENDADTFIHTNYNSLSGGTFGGGFEDVGPGVLADADLTFAGFSGVHDLGNVFPTGMDFVQLEAYLSTAVYTGALGTGQWEFDLVPEPATMALLGLGGLALLRRRRRSCLRP
jgi:hypothetical protein